VIPTGERGLDMGAATRESTVQSGHVEISEHLVDQPPADNIPHSEPAPVRGTVGRQAVVTVGGTKTKGCVLVWDEPAANGKFYYLTAWSGPDWCSSKALATYVTAHLQAITP
jgi:hypothetical protein